MTDPVRLIEIKEEIHEDNERVAQALRRELEETKTFVLNVMSSPGAGKTTTLLKTIDTLRDRFRFGVLEADIESSVDAELIAARGIPAVQLRTGGFCHLDAAMVTKGLAAMDLDSLDIVMLENIGNLVCPAEFDTGAIRNAMILSVPEGDDKPLKYPLMFTVSDVLLVNKIDYLPFSNFDLGAMRKRVLALNPRIQIFEISSKTGQGFDRWAAWLSHEAESFIAAPATARPMIGKFTSVSRC
ncbi:MAG TPA: hydrogenase nickel incorporation protein HypB [Candidatus Binataceae bacterium]|nr:hydrogenase nickel incorporation protein HypB [Candidatus Binataceae bacterium]